jgi:NAD(P)-dependent dehydrogenase (short-subunit alcohol dehydrogenase family)
MTIATRQRVAVVTGASRGIGAAVAKSLEEGGAFVFGLSRSLSPSSSTNRTDIQCDLSRVEEVRRAADEIAARTNGIDVLVSNAGTFLLKPAADFSHDEFADQLAVNLIGPFDVIRELLDLLANRRGHLVTIGSIADHQCFPGNAAYSASKYGLRALHEVIAVEHKGRIRATLVSPGPTNTALWDPVDPDRREDLPNRADMLGPQDVADAVMFAVSRPAHANVDVIRLASSGLTGE